MLGLALALAGCGGDLADRPPADDPPWAPPSLTDPTTIRVDADGAHLRLKAARDYVVELTQPVRAVGGVTIVGGRNVVLIGGCITIPWAGDDATPQERRALELRDQTGVVHIQDLLVDNSGGDLSEGIQIAAPDAVVQLQNVRIEGVHARDQAGFSDNHPDLIQPWGGVRELRVHRFTGTTRYQGFFLAPTHSRIGRVVLDQVNVVGLAGARYLYWQGPGVNVEVSDVWAQPAPGRSLRRSVEPEPPVMTWHMVREGHPPGGDFVPSPRSGRTPSNCGWEGGSPTTAHA